MDISQNSQFRLDRAAFTIRKHGDEIAENREYWLSKTPMERVEAAWHLSCRVYNLDPNVRNPMDRTAFEIRKRPN